MCLIRILSLAVYFAGLVLEIAVAMKERVHEGAASMSHGRMDHHPRGLRDHRQVLVLEDHLERNRLGNERLGRAARTDDLDAIPFADPAGRAGRRVVQPDVPAVDCAAYMDFLDRQGIGPAAHATPTKEETR